MKSAVVFAVCAALLCVVFAEDACSCQKIEVDFDVDLLQFYNLITDATHADCGDGFGDYDKKPVLRWILNVFENLEKKLDQPCKFKFEIFDFATNCESLQQTTSTVKQDAEKAAAFAGALCKCGCAVQQKEKSILQQLIVDTARFLEHQLKK